jgi:hypothetical protein
MGRKSIPGRLDGQMARCPLIIRTALVLSTCAFISSTSAQTNQYPDPATVKAEREAASNAYGLCLDRAAKRLDDHKSDPATIAKGMMSACSTEFDEDVKVHSRYLDNGLEGQQTVARALREASLDGAIQLVLAHRKAALNVASKKKIAPSVKVAGKGPGISPCSQYNASRSDAKEEFVFMSWGDGFLTGYNMRADMVELSALTGGQQLQFVRDYCDQHPDKRYLEAILALIQALRTSAASK